MFRVDTAPLFFLAAAFALGLLLGPPTAPWVAGLVTVVFAATAMAGLSVRLAPLALFVLLGMLRTSTVEPAAAPTDARVRRYRVHQLEPPTLRERGFARLEPNGGLIEVRWARGDHPFRGARRVVSGRVERPRRRGDRPVLRVGRGAWHAVDSGTPSRVAALRARVERVIDRGARRPDTRAVLRALVLGDARGIPPRTREAFARTGTAHVLAISGLHVGGVLAAVAWAVRRLRVGVCASWARGAVVRGRGRVVDWAFGLVASGAYVILAGAPVSARRAWSMAFVAVIASVAGRGVVGWNALGAAALTVGWVDPKAVTSLGAGLSFAAVAGLLAAAPVGRRIASSYPRLLRPFVGAVWASCVTFAATAPLVAFAFGRIAPAALWVNLAAVPVFVVLLVPALAGATGGLFWPEAGALGLSLADLILGAALDAVSWAATPSRCPVVLWQPGAVLVAGVHVAWVVLLLQSSRRGEVGE